MNRAIIVTAVTLTLMSGLLAPGGNGKGKPAAPPQPEGRCPLVYAPVICDGGKIFPNPCVAEQHHAKNCQPLGV